MATGNTNTIRLHRVLMAPPERVYRAFLDPGAMCKWLPPNGFTGQVHHLEPKVGGTYKMSFTNFSTGNSHSFGGEYLELKPNELIRHTDSFDDPNMPGEMVTTITFKRVSVGTELEHRSGRRPRLHPTRGLLSGLAGITDVAGPTGPGQDPRPDVSAKATDDTDKFDHPWLKAARIQCGSILPRAA